MDESAPKSTEDNADGLHSRDNGSQSNTNRSDKHPIRDDIRAERVTQYILSIRMGTYHRIDFAVFLLVQPHCS